MITTKSDVTAHSTWDENGFIEDFRLQYSISGGKNEPSSPPRPSQNPAGKTVSLFRPEELIASIAIAPVNQGNAITIAASISTALPVGSQKQVKIGAADGFPSV
jgi:hypothetical protein